MLNHWKQVVLGALLIYALLLRPAATASTVPLPGAVPISPLPPPAVARLTWPDEGLPPACTFPAAADAAAESAASKPPPVTYTFSAPRVVFNNPAGVDISQWLPDNRRILIARSRPDSDTSTLELLDTTTGKSEVIGSQHNRLGDFVWLADEARVIYPDFRVLGVTSPLQYGIWSSDAAAPEPQPVVSDIDAYSTTLDSSGALVRLQTPAQPLPALPDATRSAFGASKVTLDLPSLVFFDEPGWKHPVQTLLHVRAVRSPNGQQLLLAADSGLHLVDLGKQTICTLDLGHIDHVPRAVLESHWSPDGRRLALQTFAGDHAPLISLIELTVIDLATGAVRQVPLAESVIEIDWAPDSRHLVVALDTYTENQLPGTRLALIDVITGESEPVLPGRYFSDGNGTGMQMAWSDDGKQIAIACPVLSKEGLLAENHICLLAVQTKS